MVPVVIKKLGLTFLKTVGAVFIITAFILGLAVIAHGIASLFFLALGMFGDVGVGLVFTLFAVIPALLTPIFYFLED